MHTSHAGSVDVKTGVAGDMPSAAEPFFFCLVSFVIVDAVNLFTMAYENLKKMIPLLHDDEH